MAKLKMKLKCHESQDPIRLIRAVKDLVANLSEYDDVDVDLNLDETESSDFVADEQTEQAAADEITKRLEKRRAEEAASAESEGAIPDSLPAIETGESDSPSSDDARRRADSDSYDAMSNFLATQGTKVAAKIRDAAIVEWVRETLS